MVYTKDAVSVVSSVYDEIHRLILLRRESSEFFPDYEICFNAQVARFNAIGSSVTFSGAISALMLLTNAGVDSSQQISILAAAAMKDSSLTVS